MNTPTTKTPLRERLLSIAYLVDDLLTPWGDAGERAKKDAIVADIRAEAAALSTPPEGMDVDEWAELYRLREDAKGPDGFGTWKDAAVAERVRRVEAERKLEAALATPSAPVGVEGLPDAATYLETMQPIPGAASREWMRGWDACCAYVRRLAATHAVSKDANQ